VAAESAGVTAAAAPAPRATAEFAQPPRYL